MLRPPDNGLTQLVSDDRGHRGSCRHRCECYQLHRRGSCRPNGSSHRYKNGWSGIRRLLHMTGWSDSWARCGFRRSRRRRTDSRGIRCCCHLTGWSDSWARCGFRRSCRRSRGMCCFHCRLEWSGCRVAHGRNDSNRRLAPSCAARPHRIVRQIARHWMRRAPLRIRRRGA